MKASKSLPIQGGEVADGGVQPDVEVLARRVGDLDAEVGRVAADVPVAQAVVAIFIGLEPFTDLVQHFGLQAAGVLRPLRQELHAARVAELEEVVLAGLEHWRGTRQHRVGVLQLGGRVDGAAHLAGVAVLVFRAALGAFALDEAVGQEHRLGGVEELLDGLGRDQLVLAQREVDGLGEFVVLRPVGRVPVIEADVKAVEVLLATGGDARDEVLRRLAGLLGRNHDRGAMGVIRADEVHLRARHALVANPDIGLGVLHDVADVETGIGIGQGSGDEKLAGHGRCSG
jgi:hypothetical protein